MLDWNFDDFESGLVCANTKFSVDKWCVGFKLKVVENFLAEKLDGIYVLERATVENSQHQIVDIAL